jgi:hypothetical protein
MKQFLLSVSLLIGAAVNAQDCSELFISEYVEGVGNNKALEIYNPTNQAIDLGDYLIQRYSNGSTSPEGDTPTQGSVQLNGTINALSTYVAVIDLRDPNGIGQDAPIWDDLEAKADGFYCPEYEVSYAMYFNGNDAVVLAKGSITDLDNIVLVDVFGKIGEDPEQGNYNGWTSDFPYVGAGAVVTEDHSMIRKSTILSGETNPVISFFNPLLEYDSIPPIVIDPNTGNEVGNWASLGSHNCECDPASSVSQESLSEVVIYPNPSENGAFTIRVDNGIEKLEVINALGQNIFTETDLDAVSKINVGSKTGVYFVKIITKDGRLTSRRVIIK